MIDTKADCRAAATALGRTFRAVTPINSIIRGCVSYEGDNVGARGVYLNTHTGVSTAAGGVHKLCCGNALGVGGMSTFTTSTAGSSARSVTSTYTSSNPTTASSWIDLIGTLGDSGRTFIESVASADGLPMPPPPAPPPPPSRPPGCANEPTNHGNAALLDNR